MHEIGIMTQDGIVQVFPAKSIGEIAFARVIVSGNENKIVALAFDHIPSFARDGIAVHPEYGSILVLSRDESSSPFWRDLFSGQLFGISVAG